MKKQAIAKQKLWRNLVRKQEGVTAIEFALLAPVLFLLLFGIIEFSLLMFASSVIEGATSTAARLSRTGAERSTAGTPAQQAFADSARLRQMILEHGGGLLKNDNLNVTTIPQTSVVGSMGGANEMVTYNVTYNWIILTPLVGKLIAPDGVYSINSTAVVMNEPFPGN